MMLAEARTWAGNPVNEDAACLGLRSGAIVDGATGLGESSIPGWESAAAWFSHRLAPTIVDVLEKTDTHPARALRSALESIREECAAIGRDPDGGPSGSVCAFRIARDRLELTLLGDCTVVVIERSGEALVLRDEVVPRMDAGIVTQMVALAAERGTTVAEVREVVGDLLAQNRARRNTPDGYWIADLSGAGVPHARSHAFAWSEVAQLFVATDGFAAAVDPLRLVDDYVTLAREVGEGRAHELVRKIREREAADSHLTSYPRLKVRDDATYLNVRRAERS